MNLFSASFCNKESLKNKRTPNLWKSKPRQNRWREFISRVSVASVFIFIGLFLQAGSISHGILWHLIQMCSIMSYKIILFCFAVQVDERGKRWTLRNNPCLCHKDFSTYFPTYGVAFLMIYCNLKCDKCIYTEKKITWGYKCRYSTLFLLFRNSGCCQNPFSLPWVLIYTRRARALCSSSSCSLAQLYNVTWHNLIKQNVACQKEYQLRRLRSGVWHTFRLLICT